MRAGDQFTIARMHLQVVHRHRREVVVEHEPGRTLVERRVHAKLRARVQQRRVDRILAHHIHRVRATNREAGRNRAERLPEIVRHVQIRREVVVAVIVERHVHGGGIGRTRVDLAHVRERRNTRKARAQIFPRAAVVLREPHLAVVRAHVQHTGFERRLGDRHNRRILLSTGRIAGDAAGGVHRRIAVNIEPGGNADACLIAR